jgi:DNA-binding NtrC family response regulator
MPAKPQPKKAPMEFTILLLISEPLVRLTMQEVLERAGYLVMATGDLGTAVDRLKECKPDLLIISPYVDTISGHEAGKYLQSRCPSMRILMVAGFLADDRLRYRAELERVEIFPQPFTGAQLLEKVRQVLAEPRVGGVQD